MHVALGRAGREEDHYRASFHGVLRDSSPLFQIPVHFSDAGSFVLFSSEVLGPITLTGWPVASVKCVCCMETGFGGVMRGQRWHRSAPQRQDARGTRHSGGD